MSSPIPQSACLVTCTGAARATREAPQWVLGQYEYFDTIQGAKCDGTYKMPECDFVNLVVDALAAHMPKFIGIYRQTGRGGRKTMV